jgi:hypothetical protein
VHPGRAVLLAAYQDWHCPACGHAERTRPYPPNTARLHVCPRLGMISAPLARAGTDCTIIANVREDYLAGEIQESTEDGRPIMGVSVVYADGHNDLVVKAPLAVVEAEAAG